MFRDEIADLGVIQLQDRHIHFLGFFIELHHRIFHIQLTVGRNIIRLIKEQDTGYTQLTACADHMRFFFLTTAGTEDDGLISQLLSPLLRTSDAVDIMGVL